MTTNHLNEQSEVRLPQVARSLNLIFHGVRTSERPLMFEAVRQWLAKMDDSRASVAAPQGDEDQQLAERLRTLLSSAFITGHMHGPSKDYQVQMKFKTLDESQRAHTLICALVNPEYRESFIKQGVLAPFATPVTAPVSTGDARLWGELLLDANGEARFICHTKDQDFAATKTAFEKFIALLQQETTR